MAKDEIKEFIEFRTDEDGTYFYYNDKDNIEQWSYKLDELKDYITNLQEELKSANESISWWQNRFNAVEKENGRYKMIFEGKERFSKIMPDDTDFIILSKADYDRQQEDIELGLIDYKTRNEKAIEYINTHYVIDKPILFKNTLLDILQGGDK